MGKKQISQQDELPDAPEIVSADGEETVGTGNDQRLAMMARINDQVDSDRVGELANVNDDETTEPFTVEHATAKDEPAVEPLVAEPIAEEEQVQTPQKFKIKVNGKEMELTQDELIERAQKVEAADVYLAEAARLRKEQQDVVTPKQQQQPAIDDAAAAEDEERAMVRAIQMGTEEEALTALRKLKSRGPSITSDDITRTVDERLTFKEAARRFQTEYKDIMDDPVLRKMALQRDQELLSAGDKREYWERYQEVGTELRTWRDGLIKAHLPAEQPAPEIPQNAKQQRKAAAPSVPVAASKKAPSTADQEEKEESIPEIIANIAKARGGPQWARS